MFVHANTLNIDANDVISAMELRDVLNCGNSVLSCDEMKRAYESLLNAKSNISTQEHIVNVKQQKINVERGYCPRCGSKLIIKKGKYGEFWGCSNYPKCKFTSPIE